MAAASRPSCSYLPERDIYRLTARRLFAEQLAIAPPGGRLGVGQRFQGSSFPLSGRHSTPLDRSSRIRGSDHRRHATISCSAEDRSLPFYKRLVKAVTVAWDILFPPPEQPPSVAEIAKQRLRVVLISDRGQVSPEVRGMIRSRIIEAISDFVEVESEDEVQVKTIAEPGLGTIYSVTVPVRRVRPEFQEFWGGSSYRDRAYEEGERSRASSRLLSVQVNPQSIQFEGIVEDPERG